MKNNEATDEMPDDCSAFAGEAPPKLWRTTATFASFLLGSVLTLTAYQHWSPLIIGAAFFLIGYAPLVATGRSIRSAYTFHYSVFWVAAGLAAVSHLFYGDYAQAGGDAAYFYQMATAPLPPFELLYRWSDGAAGIIAWHHIYELAQEIGLGTGPYVGITFNVVVMAWTGAICVQVTRLAFGPTRAGRLASVFPMAGIYWLFAGIHNRDGMIALVIILLVGLWTQFLVRRSASWFVLAISLTAASPPLFRLLRLEFFYLPIAIGAFAIVSIPLEWSRKQSRRRQNALIGIIAVPIVVGVAAIFGTPALERLTAGHQSYVEFTAAEVAQGDGSLGAVIVNAPMLAKVVLGPMYLFTFPIPFWKSLSLDSAYQMFKSINAIFMVFWLPAMALAMLRFAQHPATRTAPAWFFLVNFWTFTLAVSLSSLETRHFGVFLPIGMILSMVPNYGARKDREEYKQLLFLTVVVIASIYALWAMLKFL